jgi:histidine triad (HIT) family protein
VEEVGAPNRLVVFAYRRCLAAKSVEGSQEPAVADVAPAHIAGASPPRLAQGVESPVIPDAEVGVSLDGGTRLLRQFTEGCPAGHDTRVAGHDPGDFRGAARGRGRQLFGESGGNVRKHSLGQTAGQIDVGHARIVAQSPVVPAHTTDCLFCAIIAGAPAQIVLDTPEVVAFLDIRPIFPGHTLVLPRSHVETLEDLPVDDIGPYFAAVQQVTIAVRQAMGATGTFVGINNKVSQSVPHLHTHVVPRNPKDGLRGFFWPRGRYESDEQMGDVAAAIRRVLPH